MITSVLGITENRKHVRLVGYGTHFDYICNLSMVVQ